MLRRGGQRKAGKVSGPLEAGGLRLDPDAHEATLDGMPLDLSRREFDLLHYLTLHAGQVVTRRDLLTHVWQMPYGGADKTVDVHISWLRRKLGETAQRPRYLHTVRGVGIKLSPRAATGMRLRIVALVVATSSLVLVSFLVPLALVLRTLAADHAVSTATVEAQSMAPLVTTLDAAWPAAGRGAGQRREQHAGHHLPARRDHGRGAGAMVAERPAGDARRSPSAHPCRAGSRCSSRWKGCPAGPR